MKVLEFLKKSTAEEMANEIMNYNSKFRSAFDIGFNGNYFDEAMDCPIECRYLEGSYEYECTDYNGMCNLKNKECPYRVDREESVRKQFIEWLNSEM